MAKRSIYELTAEQKEEIRRLTQLANRRIKAFTKEYEKYGLEIIPHEVSGGIQLRDQWHTPKTPLSRSVRFSTEREYRERLRFLRTFEQIRPNVTQFTKIQQRKTIDAVTSSLGRLTHEEKAQIEDMDLGQLAKFWQKFSDESRRLGLQYSSEAAMQATLEFFNEDRQALMDRVGG